MLKSFFLDRFYTPPVRFRDEFRISDQLGSADELKFAHPDQYTAYMIPDGVRDPHIYGAGLAFQNGWSSDGTVSTVVRVYEK